MSVPARLKKARLLQLKLRQKVRDLFAGGYRSAFKGQGMTFADYRRYVPGDDVRAISWPLTARTGVPYIKIFEEEKGATFLLVLDISASFDFGGAGFKGEAAAELASLIAFSAERNQDRVGLLLFSDRVEHYVPPTARANNVARLTRDMYAFERQSRRTDITPALDFLNRVLKKQCHIFIFSDFFNPGDFEKPLQILSRRHDVVAAVVQDPFEQKLPPIGLMEMEDAEDGRRVLLNTSSRAFRRQYEEDVKARLKRVEKVFHHARVDYFPINTGRDIFKQLLHFIKKRQAG